MSVIDDLFNKKPEHRTVELCADTGLSQWLSAAQVELEQAKRRAARAAQPAEREAAAVDVIAAQAVVDDLVPQVRAQLLRFTFHAVGDFERLKSEHPATPKQVTEAKSAGRPAPEWDVDTFPLALVAAACTLIETPSGSATGLALGEVERLWSSPSFNTAERAELFNAALAASTTRVAFDMPKGSAGSAASDPGAGAE